MQEEPFRNLNLPLEVQLVWEVMTCRGMRTTYESASHPCKWFNDHYGPYPAFDRLEEIRQSDEKSDAGDAPTVQPCVCSGMRFQVPELMSGCRKAPIMTIGINPNLTSYWLGTKGARWCYPYFDNIGQYAEYFRHRDVCQEAFPLAFMRDHADPTKRVVAPKAGRLAGAQWEPGAPEYTLALEYDDGTAERRAVPSDYSLFVDRSIPGLETADRFEAGEVVAGRVALEPGTPVEVELQPVGYYERFRAIFDRFKELGGADLTAADLRLAEDVCQADMVACASPGWGKYIPDDTRRGIAEECVHKRRWLPLQLLQTRPKVIVISGKSSLAMFLDAMGRWVTPPLDMDLDVYGLLRHTCEHRVRVAVDLPQQGFGFEARLVVSPHFSYDLNFTPHCRFTPEELARFRSDFPDDAVRLAPVTREDDATIWPNAPEAPQPSDIGPGARAVLEAHLVDPARSIAGVLLEEYHSGTLPLDAQGRHFARTEGACRFCRNELFSLPEGCLYGKIGERAQRLERFVAAAESMLAGKVGK